MARIVYVVLEERGEGQDCSTIPIKVFGVEKEAVAFVLAKETNVSEHVVGSAEWHRAARWFIEPAPFE